MTSFNERVRIFLLWCERALETRHGRICFWTSVVLAFLIIGGNTLRRSDVPRKKLVPAPRYSSPMEIGESNDEQAVWRSSEFRGFRRLSWGTVMEDRNPYLGGDAVRGVGHVRAYPPFFAIAFFPFAALWQVPMLGSGLFFLIGFAFAVMSAWYASGWTSRDGQPRFGRFALLFILLAPLAFSVMVRSETDMYVLFPVTLGCCWLAQGRRPVGAGALLGFAACFKVLPGLFGIYLLCTRQWRALAGMVAMGLFCMVLLPLLVWGPARSAFLYKSWCNAVVGPYGMEGPGRIISNPFREPNQSLAATVHRFLRPVPVSFHVLPEHMVGKGKVTLNIVNVPAHNVARLVRALQAGVLLTLIVVWACCARNNSPWNRAALLATAGIGILLLSDVSLTTHHVLLFPAMSVVLTGLLADEPGARKWTWTLSLYALAMVLLVGLKPLSPLLAATLTLTAATLTLAWKRRETVQQKNP